MSASAHSLASQYPRRSGMSWADVRDYGAIEREVRPSGSVRIRLSFANPWADNAAKRWNTDPLENAWRKAFKAAKVPFISFQQATRHTTLSHLSKTLPQTMLMAFSRHKEAKSLEHYTLASPDREAIVTAMKPRKEKK